MNGGNVYAETSRYNYGPLWFTTLGALELLFGEHLRAGIVLLLSLADVGIAAALWRQRIHLGALLFLVSPLTVYVSGYANQFDNIAVLIVLWAALLFGDEGAERGRTRALVGFSALLGVSLIVKHVFALFVFWLAARQRSLGRALAAIAIPCVMFLAAFVPYVEVGKVPGLVRSGVAMVEEYRAAPTTEKLEAAKQRFLAELRKAPALFTVVTRVLLYRSADNRIFCRYFMPRALAALVSPLLVFVLAVLAAGYLSRTASLFESVLRYTAILVIVSPAIANQYLAIPVAFTAAHLGPFSLGYNLLALIYLPLSRAGAVGTGDAYLAVFVLLLVLSVGYASRARLAQLLRRCADALHRMR